MFKIPSPARTQFVTKLWQSRARRGLCRHNPDARALVASWPASQTDRTGAELIKAAMLTDGSGNAIYPGFAEALQPVAGDRHGFFNATVIVLRWNFYFGAYYVGPFATVEPTGQFGDQYAGYDLNWHTPRIDPMQAIPLCEPGVSASETSRPLAEPHCSRRTRLMAVDPLKWHKGVSG